MWWEGPQLPWLRRAGGSRVCGVRGGGESNRSILPTPSAPLATRPPLAQTSPQLRAPWPDIEPRKGRRAVRAGGGPPRSPGWEEREAVSESPGRGPLPHRGPAPSILSPRDPAARPRGPAERASQPGLQPAAARLARPSPAGRGRPAGAGGTGRGCAPVSRLAGQCRWGCRGWCPTPVTPGCVLTVGTRCRALSPGSCADPQDPCAVLELSGKGASPGLVDACVSNRSAARCKGSGTFET